MPRRFPQWAERLLQAVLSVAVALGGLFAWSHARGEAAGLEAGRVLVVEGRLDDHVNDADHHFSREDAERLVRVEQGVQALLKKEK